MAPTRFHKFSRFAAILPPAWFFLGCLLILPYASYAALIGMGGLTLWIWLRHGPEIWPLLNRQGWTVLALGMAITVIPAYSPAEAGLQLANFLPFFLFFGCLAVWFTHLPSPVAMLESWALALVVGAIPISLRAALEYYLRAPSVMAQLLHSPYFNWLYSQPNYGHRAHSVFGHPNVLGAYLIIILGLGLGLCLKVLRGGPLASNLRWRYWPATLYGAIALSLVGIFCSGSRNAVGVAIFQILVFGWLMRRNRLVMFLGLSGITAVLLAVATWGIGGRSVGEAVTTSSLRMDVWHLALGLIRQHPLLGLGLGGFKLSYVPYSIPQYDTVQHAHNLWLMLAAEIGIPLMVLFTVIVGGVCCRGVLSLVRRPFSSQDQAVLVGYALAFTGCILFALFDVTFYDSRVNVLGWLTLAAIQAFSMLPQQATGSGTKSA